MTTTIIIILSIALGGAAVLLRGAYVRQKELMAEVDGLIKDNDKLRVDLTHTTAVKEKASDLLCSLSCVSPRDFGVVDYANGFCAVYAEYENYGDIRVVMLKKFTDSDPEYNLNCANELKEKLEERV